MCRRGYRTEHDRGAHQTPEQECINRELLNLSQREMWTLLEVQEREVLLATIEEMKLQQKKEQRDPSPLHSTLAQNRVCLGSAR